MSIDHPLRWGLKQSCSPCWDLSNYMLHATCMQGNRGDSWLLVVGSQIANLIPGLSFGHNLCFRCPNGSCKPISNIYIPSASMIQGMSQSNEFWPLQSPSKELGICWDSNSQNGSSLGSVKVHSLTLFCIHESMKCDSRAQSWLAPLQTFTLVMSPRLRLRQLGARLRAKAMGLWLSLWLSNLYPLKLWVLGFNVYCLGFGL